MKTVEFEKGQSGKEWLDWRRNGIGASDIGVIMGNNPYKSIYKLWQEKVGEIQESTEITPPMRYGIQHEALARELFNETYNSKATPICIESEKNEHFKASLDGYDEELDLLVEIKCPIGNKISMPKSWEDQLQWQLFVSGCERGYLFVWREEGPTAKLFSYDRDYADLMERKANEFWENVKNKTPPARGPSDHLPVDDPNLYAYLLQYETLHHAESELKKKKKALKENIEGYMKEGSIRCKEFKLTKTSPRITYDYSRMGKEGIDLDNYKLVGNPGFRISLTDNYDKVI